MCQPRLSSDALGLLRKVADSQGRLAVPLASPQHRRKNRLVMQLIVAGLLRPVEIETDDAEGGRIVYSLEWAADLLQ